MFGGSADHGSKPNHATTGSRSIIRKSLQQLDQAKLIKTVEKKGRIISPAGMKFLDKLAHKVRLEIGKDDPEIMKY
jgi:small subunit ribosomal protein S19e